MGLAAIAVTPDFAGLIFERKRIVKAALKSAVSAVSLQSPAEPSGVERRGIGLVSQMR